MWNCPGAKRRIGSRSHVLHRSTPRCFDRHARSSNQPKLPERAGGSQRLNRFGRDVAECRVELRLHFAGKIAYRESRAQGATKQFPAYVLHRRISIRDGVARTEVANLATIARGVHQQRIAAHRSIESDGVEQHRIWLIPILRGSGKQNHPGRDAGVLQNLAELVSVQTRTIARLNFRVAVVLQRSVQFHLRRTHGQRDRV